MRQERAGSPEQRPRTGDRQAVASPPAHGVETLMAPNGKSRFSFSPTCPSPPHGCLCWEAWGSWDAHVLAGIGRFGSFGVVGALAFFSFQMIEAGCPQARATMSLRFAAKDGIP